MGRPQEISLAEAATHIRNTSKRHDRPFFFMAGAGVSAPPIPLAGQIVETCKKECGACEPPAGLSPMAEYSWWFQRAFHSPADRQWYLRKLIEGKYVSQANLRLAHLLLSKQIGNLVVTTNFDDFVSRSLSLFGEPHIVCDHPQTIQRIDPESSDLQIVHVHGTYWFYDCCNLEGELEARSSRSSQTASSMADFLDRVLSNRAPLVLGYSGWEGDVFMKALKRRLQTGLPYNLYWFCYQRSTIQTLPEEIREHPNVFFVHAGAAAAPGAAEPRLKASDVLDALVVSMALDAPPLTKDPLQFFAGQLRRSLPEDDPANPAPDPYLITKVIRRIERASQNLSAAEQRLETIRDALRRSQYGEVLRAAAQVADEELDDSDLRELVRTICEAATMLETSSPEEFAAYDRVVASGDRLLARRADDAAVKECIAKALVNKGKAFGRLGHAAQELEMYEAAITRFENATEPDLQYQLARALYDKSVACTNAGNPAAGLASAEILVQRFGGAEVGRIRRMAGWGKYNAALSEVALGRPTEAEARYRGVAEQFESDSNPDARELVALSLNNVADLIIRDAKSVWAGGDEPAGKARLREAVTCLAKAAECEPSNAYVLGTQAYVDYLLGATDRARELLKTAIQLGGNELILAELETAHDHPVEPDEEFVRLVETFRAPQASAAEA